MARVYISGGITNVPNYKENFARAEKKLKNLGFKVVNPVSMEDVLPVMNYEEYMKLDMCLLSMCDTIYLLKGWEKSTGANREYGYALAKGYKVLKEY